MSFNDSINSSPSLRSLRDVRILLIGDRGVGKTSLIRTLMNDKFVSDVPPRSADVAVPPEMTQKEVTTYIIDTSLRVQDESEIASEISKASAICVVYAADKEETYKRVSSFWLPLIRRCSVDTQVSSKTPVILVRNKSDLCEYVDEVRRSTDSQADGTLLNECMTIMQEFKEIITCVDCSAKAVRHIPDVFHYALNSVLFPMTPLYDLDNQRLKSKVIKALDRVFLICDRDQDGLLSDEEVNGFQTCCFQGSEPLAIEELKNVKELIALNVVDGLKNGSVTRDGFLFLNRLFIERAKPETTWAVLRHFGYSDELDLIHSYLCPTSLKQCPQDCSMELSGEGTEFILNLFDVYQKKTAGKELTQHHLEQLFQAADEYPSNFRFATGKTCSKSTFIDTWKLLVLLDHVKASSLLAMLGFCTPENRTAPRSVARAISPSRRRLIDWETGFTARKTFLCFVVGSASVRNAFYEHNITNGLVFENLHRPYLERLVGRRCGEYLLCFADVEANIESTFRSETCTNECDVIVILYEDGNADSFAVACRHKESIAVPGPQFLLVGVNLANNLDQMSTRTDKRVYEWQRNVNPLRLTTEDLEEVAKRVVNLATNPRLSRGSREGSLALYVGIVFIATFIGAVVCNRYLQK